MINLTRRSAYASTRELIRRLGTSPSQFYRLLDQTNSFLADGASGLQASGDRAFVGNGSSGLQLIDITTPASPTLVANVVTPGSAQGVVVAGDYAFVTGDAAGLHVVQVNQREFDTTRNIGQSLAIDDASLSILRARMATTQTDGVVSELSADGGTIWLPAAPDTSWHLLAPGSDLVWRSTHSWFSPGVNPNVSNLLIDWLFEAPVVDAITDIGNDQGRQVSIEWTRSAHDFVGDSLQVVEYAVYRKIDPNLSKTELAVAPGERTSSTCSKALELQIETLTQAGWHFVSTVPASATDGYAVVACRGGPRCSRIARTHSIR